MEIKRAIITAAGKSQRTLPLQSLVDRDGQTKTALAIIIEEVLAAGIEELCVVVCPGDERAFRAAAGEHAKRLEFVEQKQPLGYGHAVSCAAKFAGKKPFLLLVGDHLYVSGEVRRCAQQLVEVAAKEDCAVSAVQATHESKLPYYGAVGGRLVAARKGLYEITEVVEKPTPTVAEQRLIVFGMHVLTPSVMALLAEEVAAAGTRGGVHLSATLAKLARKERYLAAELTGRRYDIGAHYGLLTAQLALALSGKDRDEVLTGLVELLAQRVK
jgi:UTP--glucose-1-phosphate uridylyltransferase